jgi:hypothetical protein
MIGVGRMAIENLRPSPVFCFAAAALVTKYLAGGERTVGPILARTAARRFSSGLGRMRIETNVQATRDDIVRPLPSTGSERRRAP